MQDTFDALWRTHDSRTSPANAAQHEQSDRRATRGTPGAFIRAFICRHCPGRKEEERKKKEKEKRKKENKQLQMKTKEEWIGKVKEKQEQWLAEKTTEKKKKKQK